MEREQRDLEARMDRLRPMAGPVAFDAGFADRVMARLREEPSLSDGLQGAFFRLAPLAAAAILVLAAANLAGTQESGQPLLDRVLRLRPVTLGAAVDAERGVSLTTEEQP
ncbi:MAG: hypothetical protein FIA95_08640 [Gemmatimonadetes bacterium]|nr:hypothetical protein [Gemmatimonadota bacterium]